MVKGKEAARELHGLLYRYRPAANVQVTDVGSGWWAVDFTMGFFEGSLAPIPKGRRGSAGNSAVIIGTDGIVREFTLRFPPLPADEYDYHETQSVIASAVAENYTPGGFNIKAEPGRGSRAAMGLDPESWWPHVELHPPNRNEFTPDEFMTFLRQTFAEYRDLVYDPEEVR